jgi:nitrate reductase assembly molybdenum cofactor insertion protein NarJ
MVKNKEIYKLFAELFRYPKADYRQKTKKCQTALNIINPEAAKELELFTSFILNANDDELEVLYTRTFDVQPISYLDIGYVLFVEDYKRGEFLVNMKKEQAEAGNRCGTELPDNLVNILRLIPKMQKPEVLQDLIALALVPALDKMISEFKDARVELKLKVIRKLHKAIIREDLNIGNVYQHAFKALKKTIVDDFRIIEESVNNAEPLQADVLHRPRPISINS